MRLSFAVFFCVLLLCGTARAEQKCSLKLPVTLEYVPASGELLRDSLFKLDAALARFQREPELKLQPFNALRGGLRTNEYEDQRRAQRTLVKSDVGERSEGAKSGIMDGDLVSVASLAATYFSFNLTLRNSRKIPGFFMETDTVRPPWAIGIGLGRVGLGLRTEF